MAAGPPRPRPWQAGQTKTIDGTEVVRLTAPRAYAIWCGVVGYHVPKSLRNAESASRGLSLGR